MRTQRGFQRRRPDELAAAAEIFKALADPHRLRIFSTIAGVRKPVCVCDLNDCLPVLQPTVSHHLKVLRDTGLVVGERRGTWVYYRLSPGALERLRRLFSAATQQEWNYEDASLASHAPDRRKRGLLSKLAERATA